MINRLSSFCKFPSDLLIKCLTVGFPLQCFFKKKCVCFIWSVNVIIDGKMGPNAAVMHGHIHCILVVGWTAWTTRHRIASDCQCPSYDGVFAPTYSFRFKIKKISYET